MWLWLLLGLAVAVILFYSSSRRENMTNDELLSTLKTFGDVGTKKDSSGNKNPNAKNTAPIWGPNASPPAVPTPNPTPSSMSSSGDYPHIFGPDIALPPGTSGGSGQTGKSKFGGQANAQANGQSNMESGADLMASSGGNNGTPGLFVSDQPQTSENFEFNPDLKKAFPYEGEPQPFLTDFSKIQH